MTNVVVGVADGKCSQDHLDVLITYGLGSCIAVAFYDAMSRTAALLHFMLPESRIDRKKAQRNPYMFADTGVAVVLKQLREMGVNPRRLSVRIAGGARVLDTGEHFDIGRRNHVALRKVLWKAGLMIQAEEVGGSTSRTVRLEVGTGRCLWRESSGREGELTANGTRRGAV
jgi:chemotaxis protein CheD